MIAEGSPQRERLPELDPDQVLDPTLLLAQACAKGKCVRGPQAPHLLPVELEARWRRMILQPEDWLSDFRPTDLHPKSHCQDVRR